MSQKTRKIEERIRGYIARNIDENHETEADRIFCLIIEKLEQLGKLEY